MKRTPLLILALMFLYSMACSDTEASLSSSVAEEAVTPEPTVTVVWPKLQEVAPDPAIPGQTVRVIGTGGYHIMPDGGYDESSRPFPLYFDDEPASAVTCYVNRCEGDLLVPTETLSGTHSVSTDGGSEIPLRVVVPEIRAYMPLVQRRHEAPCERERADLSIASDSVARVGEPLTVTLSLKNVGCLGLGLPQYRLYAEPSGDESPFGPMPGPIVHYLGVPPGGIDAATLVLQTVRPGAARLRGSASYEIHQGYPRPAYWANASSGQVNVTVAQ